VAAVATINDLPADPVITSGERCGPGTVMLGATSVNPVIWYDADTLGNQVGAGTTFNTPSISSTTIYYAQSNNGICQSNRIAATATVHPLPQVNLGPDTIIIGVSFIIDAGAGFKSYLWSTGDTSQTISHHPLVASIQQPGVVVKKETGTWFLDFGKDAFAQLQLHLNSEKNDSIWIEVAEALEGRKVFSLLFTVPLYPMAGNKSALVYPNSALVRSIRAIAIFMS